MIQKFHSLEYLCIEEIGRNINFLSRKYSHHFKFGYCRYFGDKLILSSISNSFDKLDEECLEFIFNNFYVSEFKICCNLNKILNNFKFLNERNLKILEVCCENELNTGINNFRLSIDKLKVVFYSKVLKKNINFFGNIFVKNSLVIHIFVKCSSTDDKFLSVPYKILENISENLEYLEMKTPNFLKHSPEKLRGLLIERKCLKKIKIHHLNSLFNELAFGVQSKSLANVTHYRTSITEDWKFRQENELLKSLTSLQHLKLHFGTKKYSSKSDELKKYFATLDKYHAHKLQYLDIFLPNSSEVTDFLYNCLRNCTLLVKISLLNWDRSLDNISLFFKSLYSSLEKLTYLNLNNIVIKIQDEIKSLCDFISHSHITEIKLEYVEFIDGFFQKFLSSLENIKNNLTSISIFYCKLGNDDIKLLSISLKEFSNLHEFSIFKNQFNEYEIFCLFKSLQSLCKNLEKINIYSITLTEIKSYPINLFEFFNKCEKLKSIRLKFKLRFKYNKEFLSILTKFTNNLQEIELDFLYLSHCKDILNNFFSKCYNLVKIRNISEELGYDDKITKKVLKSLENSKYKLEKLPNYPDVNYPEKLHVFPKVFQLLGMKKTFQL